MQSVEIGAVLAILAAAFTLGALFGSSRHRATHEHDESEHEEMDDEARWRRVQQRYRETSARLADAIDVFGGPRKRLLRLAETASAQAATLREVHAAGLVVKQRRVDADWEPPWELRRDGPRLPIAAWQVVDRAFDSLIAALDDPAVDLQARALAFDGLATAARQVADALTEPEFDSANASCTFCGGRSADVRKLIASPSALICDECVVLCVEILEDQLGTDWRGSHGSD